MRKKMTKVCVHARSHHKLPYYIKPLHTGNLMVNTASVATCAVLTSDLMFSMNCRMSEVLATNLMLTWTAVKLALWFHQFLNLMCLVIVPN